MRSPGMSGGSGQSPLGKPRPRTSPSRRPPSEPPRLEGFWLPRALRDRFVAADTAWAEARFARGREVGVECPLDEPGPAGARWPSLSTEHWETLLQGLREARLRAPRGPEFWDRLQAALPEAARRLADPAGPARRVLADALPAYTGFSPAMIAATLDAPEMWDLRGMASSYAYRPSKAQAARWRPLPGLPGRVRFFPEKPIDRLAPLVPVAWEMPLVGAPEAPGTVLGYGAGNVPGTALIIALLALSTTLAGEAPPAVLVRNSRREPIFSPLVLSALEDIDEELVSTVAVLVWDIDDPLLQSRLLGAADLVLAATGDDTIARIETALASSARPGARPARLHPHGHKVGFSVIGREALDPIAVHSPTAPRGSAPGKTAAPEAGLFPATDITWVDTFDMIASLTALDSAYWDQYGCLSSGIHFVERADPADWVALRYAERLTVQLRRLSRTLPRGAWPLRCTRDAFDRYKAIESSGGRSGAGLRVLSAYEDPFVVVLDEREVGGSGPDPSAFAAAVNECQGRVVVVRPVGDIMEVPQRYLSLLLPSSLQSLSVAVGRPGEGLSDRFLDFATACGARGVTAIRAAGRGAFPLLFHSWDGLLPLDLICRRPQGHFTSVEFDSPFDALLETYRAFSVRLDHLQAALGESGPESGHAASAAGAGRAAGAGPARAGSSTDAGSSGTSVS